LSRPRDFFAAFLTLFMVLESEISSKTSSAPTREYQTSSSPISEYWVIRCLYDLTASRAALRHSSSPKLLSRPATTRLAARRFTSHSQGPGSVSSKSLTSKSRVRSGEA
jgi:hypothetical protein